MSDEHVATTIRTYNNTALEYMLKVQKYAPEPERDKFMSLIKIGGRVLDAGCGSGRDANYFAAKGYVVTGIDLSDALLDFARNGAPANVEYRKMDLRDITFEPATFHGIWAAASLLHLKQEEIGPVLAKFHSLLKAGGILFLLMKDGVGERYVTGGTVENDLRFFSYYEPDEIRIMLEKAGFSVTDLYTWNQQDRNPERPHEIWISSFARK